MAIDYWAIQAALRARLTTVPGIPAAAQRAWENKQFTPTVGTPWVRESFRPSGDTLAATGTRQAQGFVQWSLFFPPDEGAKAASDLADAILSTFRPGTTLAGLVTIWRAERGPALPEQQWWHLPVTIYWRAFGTNT